MATIWPLLIIQQDHQSKEWRFVISELFDFSNFLTVCGDISCCLTPWDQGSFNEGGIDIFSGVDIGECDKFTFKSEPTGADQIGNITVPHFQDITKRNAWLFHNFRSDSFPPGQ